LLSQSSRSPKLATMNRGNQTRGPGRAIPARGRGGSAPRGGGRGGANALPIAAQLRQLDRETGPEEPRLLRRYEPIGFVRIRSEYGPSGLIGREVGRLADNNEMVWVTISHAELMLAQHERSLERERLVARIATRLDEPRPASLEECSPEHMRILRMSNTEFARFRVVPAGGQGPQEAA
jgi:hypothetical protein